jgi:nucleoside 2-deoxyribosyltransferase
MKLIYIAGPYHAATPEGIAANIRAAQAVAAQVAEIPGLYPVVPHEMNQGMQDAKPREWFLDGDTALLMRCDACVLQGDWRASMGTVAEWRTCLEEGIPVFELPWQAGRLRVWAKINGE